MIHSKIRQNKWMLIVMGVVIGLGLGVTLQTTQESQANDVIATQATLQPVTGQDIDVAEQLSSAFSRVAEQVNPSVVTIFTETTIKGVQRSPFP